MWAEATRATTTLLQKIKTNLLSQKNTMYSVNLSLMSSKVRTGQRYRTVAVKMKRLVC